MFMLNELKGGYGAYRISYAGAKDPKKNESGLSYGPNQRDMSKRPQAAVDFVDILKKAKDKSGNLIFTTEEVDRLCGEQEKNIRVSHKTPRQIFGKDLARVNAALSSAYGIRKINELYVADLHQDMTEIEAFINKIMNPAAKLFYMSDYGKAYLFDYKNKFGLNTDQKEGKFLHDYLNGRMNGREREDYSTHEKYTAPIDHYGLKDHLKFIRGTKEWAINTEDMVRRLDNIDKILVSKYQLSDAKRYCTLEVFKYSAYDLESDNDDYWNDAIFDDFNSDETFSFAIYEDIPETWDNYDVCVDYDSSIDMRAQPDVEVDPIEHSSTLDYLLKNISNNTEQAPKERAEKIEGTIETTYPSAMKLVALTHTDVLKLDSDLDSIANSISQTPILTEQPPFSTAIDMGFLAESMNYVHPDP